MTRVAVAGEDGYCVSELLQAERGVDDESLCATDPEIWMEEDNALALSVIGVIRR